MNDGNNYFICYLLFCLLRFNLRKLKEFYSVLRLLGASLNDQI